MQVQENMLCSNMKFFHRTIKNIKIVYGFKNPDEEDYTTVLTLIEEKITTEIYGLLNKQSLTLREWKEMWKYIQNITTTKFITFEILPKYIPPYYRYLKIVSDVSGLSFDNKPIIRLTVLNKTENA
jgi:hypothetical protein